MDWMGAIKTGSGFVPLRFREIGRQKVEAPKEFDWN
jgi:hypothetical protein